MEVDAGFFASLPIELIRQVLSHLPCLRDVSCFLQTCKTFWEEKIVQKQMKWFKKYLGLVIGEVGIEDRKKIGLGIWSVDITHTNWMLLLQLHRDKLGYFDEDSYNSGKLSTLLRFNLENSSKLTEKLSGNKRTEVLHLYCLAIFRAYFENATNEDLLQHSYALTLQQISEQLKERIEQILDMSKQEETVGKHLEKITFTEEECQEFGKEFMEKGITSESDLLPTLLYLENEVGMFIIRHFMNDSLYDVTKPAICEIISRCGVGGGNNDNYSQVVLELLREGVLDPSSFSHLVPPCPLDKPIHFHPFAFHPIDWKRFFLSSLELLNFWKNTSQHETNTNNNVKRYVVCGNKGSGKSKVIEELCKGMEVVKKTNREVTITKTTGTQTNYFVEVRGVPLMSKQTKSYFWRALGEEEEEEMEPRMRYLGEAVDLILFVVDASVLYQPICELYVLYDSFHSVMGQLSASDAAVCVVINKVDLFLDRMKANGSDKEESVLLREAEERVRSVLRIELLRECMWYHRCRCTTVLFPNLTGLVGLANCMSPY